MKFSILLLALLLDPFVSAQGDNGTTVKDVKSSAAPTESPAPSPNPSVAPTPGPTGTLRPTVQDSSAPTESPAPSPNPSSSPTQSPSATPTQVPSASPSDRPSDAPTESPSENPSELPSVSPVPTFGPTVSPAPSSAPTLSPSGAPSDLPSAIPTGFPSVSPAPSSTPTTGAPSFTPSTGAPSISSSDAPSTAPSIHSSDMTATLAITIDLHDKLGAELKGIFEEQAAQFIQEQLDGDMQTIEGVEIDITHLKITEQTVIPSRRLLREGRVLHPAGLRIRFRVTGVVKPGDPPPGFVFANEVGRPFRENYAMFIYRLHSEHAAFQELIEDLANTSDATALENGMNSANVQRTSAGAIAGIAIAAVGSLVLAVFAGVYAIRSRRSDDSLSGKPNLNVYMIDQVDSHSTMMTPYNEAEALSPRSLESGKGSKGSKGYRANPKSLLDDMISRNDSEDDTRHSDSDLGLKFSGAVLGAHANSKDTRRSDPPEIGLNRAVKTTIGADSMCFSGLNLRGLNPVVKTTGQESLCYSDDELSLSGSPNSVQLTPASTGVPTPSSVFSEGANLGARRMEMSEQLQFEHEDDASIGSPSIKKTGLYDVFAPSGPLGIVVDTTRNGPVVHSTKPTSPLLNLISSGDLIVGLDDMDTRSMTAATLTRLMAKRSHQPERKITLLAFESASTAN